jgi:hypothetical protein
VSAEVVAHALRRIRPNAYRIGTRDGVTTVALRSAMRATSDRPARVLIQPLREDGRRAVVEAAGGGEQGQIELVGDLAEVSGSLPPLRLCQFGQVPAAELGEPVGLMAVPAAQFGGRGDVAQPLVQAASSLRTPRGQTRSTPASRSEGDGSS